MCRRFWWRTVQNATASSSTCSFLFALLLLRQCWITHFHQRNTGKKRQKKIHKMTAKNIKLSNFCFKSFQFKVQGLSTLKCHFFQTDFEGRCVLFWNERLLSASFWSSCCFDDSFYHDFLGWKVPIQNFTSSRKHAS